MLIDSHCHIFKSEYENPDEVIRHSLENGVNKIIINGYNVISSKEAVYYAKKYENVYASIGIGPEEVNNITDEDIIEIKKLVKEDKVVAIGEIGLDYYWTKENKDKQIYVFKKMLKLAKENNLPVIVHSRDSVKDVYDLLKEYKVTGIMHCFSGSVESAREFIKLGFLIGIGGVVTFKNSKNIKEVVKDIDISDISLETDSPYLSPEPLRGKKNIPNNVFYVAEKIAQIKEQDIHEVVTKTSNAVCSKFDLK